MSCALRLAEDGQRWVMLKQIEKEVDEKLKSIWFILNSESVLSVRDASTRMCCVYVLLSLVANGNGRICIERNALIKIRFQYVYK